MHFIHISLVLYALVCVSVCVYSVFCNFIISADLCDQYYSHFSLPHPLQLLATTNLFYISVISF